MVIVRVGREYGRFESAQSCMYSKVSLSQPSRFWDHLRSQHARDLATFGVERVKRHQALRYFNWTWRWSTIRRSEQFRFLLTHTSPRTWLACATAHADLSDAAWETVPWLKRDR